MRTLAFWLVLVLVISVAKVRAQSTQGAKPAQLATNTPMAARAHVIEVTFGSAQLFNHQSVVAEDGVVTDHVVPVTSALFMFEWLFHERFGALALFNLPLVTQKTVIDGEAREEFVAPSLGLGARGSLLRLEVFAASHFELQAAALAGVTLGSSSGDIVFPLVAGRLHFSNHGGFAMYLGTAFAFRKDTVALLYGIGHRF